MKNNYQEMIEINQSIISPWKYTKNGQIIVLTNGEAVRLLQTQCYVSIGSQDLLQIIDIHKDMIFMMNRSEHWFRTFPNRSSFNKQIKALEVWMNTLTEEL